MPRLVTMHGLSRELGMSRESLRRWVRDGLIEVSARPGFHLPVFTEAEVKEIRRAVIARRLGRSNPNSSRPMVR